MNLLNFVLIDDDRINNFLVEKQLHQINPKTNIVSFTNPLEACQYLLNLESLKFENTSILLDINMPILNGWELLDRLTEKYPTILPSNCKLCMLSSSNHSDDIEKSKKYPIVYKYYVKPISKAILEEIFLSFNEN
jgi:CheY-like chemotaxis protein